MKFLFNQPLKFLFTGFLFILFLCFGSCTGGNNDKLEKANELVKKYEDLEIQFNQLASKFEADNDISKQQQAKRITNSVGDYHREMNRDYISKGQVSEGKLKVWQEDLDNFTNHYYQLKGVTSREPKTPDDEPTKKLDSDGDGVYDEKDKCPDQYGERKDGCPKKDTDGDGVYDEEDDCPNRKGTAANKGCPIRKPQPPPVGNPQDYDGDGVYDMFDECERIKGSFECKGCPDIDSDRDGICDKKDDCPTTFGKPAYRGCPPPELDRDNDGYPDSRDNCPDIKGLSPDGCPIECKSTTRFAPIKLVVECKKEVRTGKLSIKPTTNLILEEFRVVANDNGTINYYIKDFSGRNLNTRTQSNLNAGPKSSQIRTSDLLLKAGRSYELIVEVQSEYLALVADECAKGNFSNSNVELIFTNEPFIHQLTFCKK